VQFGPDSTIIRHNCVIIIKLPKTQSCVLFGCLALTLQGRGGFNVLPAVWAQHSHGNGSMPHVQGIGYSLSNGAGLQQCFGPNAGHSYQHHDAVDCTLRWPLCKPCMMPQAVLGIALCTSGSICCCLTRIQPRGHRGRTPELVPTRFPNTTFQPIKMIYIQRNACIISLFEARLIWDVLQQQLLVSCRLTSRLTRIYPQQSCLSVLSQ
jgi:hypothetical protein